MPPDAQPPARPALPRDFPLAEGEGPVAVAACLHLDAPVVGSHIDLFLGPVSNAAADHDARIARAFRLPLAAFAGRAPAAGMYEAVELEPHRAEYLALESPRELSDGRGRVEPLLGALGHAHILADRFELEWKGWRARGARTGHAQWRIELIPASHA